MVTYQRLQDWLNNILKMYFLGLLPMVLKSVIQICHHKPKSDFIIKLIKAEIYIKLADWIVLKMTLLCGVTCELVTQSLENHVLPSADMLAEYNAQGNILIGASYSPLDLRIVTIR